MRNLTKVLALVLALTMVVGVAAFAASYTDVEKNANYAEAVSVLSDLGLVKGYEDGTFGADKTLTRAEATAFVLRLMNLEEAAISNAGADTGFSDVPADHWAAGYIYTAKTNNVVAGNGDGTFAPDANLTFAQIVKMIVVALGYNPLAAELGEWPGNYITAGSQIKLTTGIAGKADEEVTRATTARLLYSALSIPKMEKKGVGVNATWEPGSTLILDDLGFYKVKGELAEVTPIDDRAKVYFDKQCFANEKGKYVETAKDMTIDYKTADDPAPADYYVDVKLGSLGKALKEVEGITSYIYLANTADGLVVASVTDAKANVETVEFVSNDVIDYDDTTDKLEYYTNAEQTKDATIKLEALDVVYNGATAVAKTADEFGAELEATLDMVVELKDTDTDGKFDYAIVTTYEYMVVKSVKESDDVYTIKGESATGLRTTLKVDTEDEDMLLTILKNGAEITVDEIEVGDVLNIVAPAGTAGINGDNEVVDATIYVTNEKVDGTVKYKDPDMGTVTLLDGTELPYRAALAGTLDRGAEGTFVLGILGNIIYIDDANIKSAYDYGFATLVSYTGKKGAISAGTIRILGTDGTWATLNLRSTFDVNGVNFKLKDMGKVEGGVTTDAFAAVDRETVDWTLAVNSGYITEQILNHMVAYKLDSNGDVKDIFVDYDAIAAETETTVSLANKKYKAYEDEDSTIGGYYVNNETIVFSVSSDAVLGSTIDESEVKVTDISVLSDDETYSIKAYDVDVKTDFLNIIYGEAFVAGIDFETPLFVVSRAVNTTLDDNDTEVRYLQGYQNGEAVEFYIDEDSEVVAINFDNNGATDGGVVAEGSAYATEIAKGDILIVNADADGIIGKAVYFGSVDPTDYDAMFSALVPGEDDGKFVFAYVLGIKNNKVYIDDTADDTFDVETDVDETTVYVTTNDKTAVTVYKADSKTPLSVGDVDDIEEGKFIIGRLDENNKIVEVIVVK